MNSINFKENELVAYIGKAPDGVIYSVEIGKIKKLCKDGAFVYYNTRNTAAKTDYRDLYKIKNAYAIDNLGGQNDEKIHGLKMNSKTLKQLEKIENIKILQDNEIEKDKIYDAYIVIKEDLPDEKIIDIEEENNE